MTTPGSESTESTAFLYPFIDSEETDAGSLLDDLSASARSKAAESARLQRESLEEYGAALTAAGAAMAEKFLRGGRLYTLGNGGSSTDAATLASLFSRPARGRAVAAWSLAADEAVVTALGNDVGFELIFKRQIIAHARDRDVAIALSTSGNSEDLMTAIAEAHRRGREADDFREQPVEVELAHVRDRVVVARERGIESAPILRREPALGDRQQLALLPAHVRAVELDVAVHRGDERVHGLRALQLVVEQRLLHLADEPRAAHVLRPQRLDHGQRLGRALGEPREEEFLLLRVVQPLGKAVDVVDHGPERGELGLHARVARGVRERDQAVQHGGERAVLVVDDANRGLHGRISRRT